MNYMDVYQSWLSSAYIDEATKEELKKSKMIRKKLRIVFTEIWNLAPVGCAELSAPEQTG